MMNVSLNELRRREMPAGDRGGGWEVDVSLYTCVCVFIKVSAAAETGFFFPLAALFKAIFRGSAGSLLSLVMSPSAVISTTDSNTDLHHRRRRSRHPSQ